MKKTIVLISIIICQGNLLHAQWTDTLNNFYDSLMMPVCTAIGDQGNPVVLSSYPDGGYFVIWEDKRNGEQKDIYAQKISASGELLWTANGVPVADGPNNQHYTFPDNQDYRHRKYAATDSAGGFYLCYADDSINNVTWHRVAIQHVRPNGNRDFGSSGFIVYRPIPSAPYDYYNIQMVEDGFSGVYLACIRAVGANTDLLAINLKSTNGQIQIGAEYLMNQNFREIQELSVCGYKKLVQSVPTSTIDYAMWPDLQGGCDFVFTMNAININASNGFLGYNKLFRPKKNSTTRQLRRDNSGIACPVYSQYTAGAVYRLYSVKTDFNTVTCTTLNGLGVTNSERLLSNGYDLIDFTGRNWLYPRGLTMRFGTNLKSNAMVLACNKIDSVHHNNYIVRSYIYKQEVFDSIPYQLTSGSGPDIVYNYTNPAPETLVYFSDTLLGVNATPIEYSLAGQMGNIYATAIFASSGQRDVKLQNITIANTGGTNYTHQYRGGSKLGDIIGKETATGFNDMGFDISLMEITTDNIPVFYTREFGRSARLSTIGEGSQLNWGAMGRPIGYNHRNGAYYVLEKPVLAAGSAAGSALMAWADNAPATGTPNSGYNIVMRSINRLNISGHIPPIRPAKPLPIVNSSFNLANPVVLKGSSKRLSLFEMQTAFGPYVSPMAMVYDEYDFGKVDAAAYQHLGAIRKTNNQPYLSRNFAFNPAANNPSSPIILRLFFTKNEFEALRAEDPTIKKLSHLSAIYQPYAGFVPGSYVQGGNDSLLVHQASDTSSGSYTIDVATPKLGNFFVVKAATINLCGQSSINISAGVNGNQYVWFVDSTNGFGVIVNGPNVSGAGTSTLRLTNIAGWNGYVIKVLVDGVPAKSVIIESLNTWTGAADNQWENPANWSCGVVPNATMDAIIPSGTVQINSNAVCNNLIVKHGASISVTPGFSITVIAQNKP